MASTIVLLNESGRWLVTQFGNMSVELAILAAIVLIALYVLRVKSPALRHLFWGLLLAKPVVTILVASPLSLYGFFWPTMPEVFYTLAPAPVQMESVPFEPPVQTAFVPEAPPIEPSRPETPSFWRQIDRYGLISTLWALVASLFGLRLLLGCAYVSFLRSTALVHKQGPLADLVNEARISMRMKRHVRIATTTVCHGPVLAGIFLPVILLPENMATLLTTRQLKLVITHELAHARRWDNLVLLIQRLAEMFFFFHPVVWFCGWMMRREAEAACDDMVVSAYGDAEGTGATAYADSLTRVAEMKCGATRRLLVNTFAAAESNFHRRISRILNGRGTRMTLWLSATACIALVAIGILGLPTASSAPLRGTPQSNETISVAQQAPEKDANNAETPAANSQRDAGSSAPVNTIQENAFAEPKLVLLDIEDSSNKPKAKIHSDSRNRSEWYQEGDKVFGRSILESIDASTGTVRLADLGDEKIKLVLRLRNGLTHLVTFGPAEGFTPKSYWDLQAVFNGICKVRTGRFKSEIKDGILVGSICTDNPEALKQSIAAEPRLKWLDSIDLTDELFMEHVARRQEEVGVELILYAPISLDYQNVHLYDIIKSISKYYKINMVIDQRAVAPRPSNNSSTNIPRGPDRVTDGMVTQFKVTDMPTRDALSELLRPLNLTYTLEPSCVWISSQALLDADAKHAPPVLNTASEELKKTLQAPVSIEFETIHIQEMMAFISDSWDINITLDSRVIRPPQGASADAVSESTAYVTDGVVSYINLHDVSLTEAMKISLRLLNLSFKGENDVVWISSYEKIMEK